MGRSRSRYGFPLNFNLDLYFKKCRAQHYLEPGLCFRVELTLKKKPDPSKTNPDPVDLVDKYWKKGSIFIDLNLDVSNGYGFATLF